MEYVIISIVALLVSGMTFFSGFGLGTLLMPAFALFFPLEVAIAATAIVHLANNIFKLILIGKYAVMSIVLKFAVPAAIAAVFGALLLNYVSDLEHIASYTFGDKEFFITPVKLIIALLMVISSSLYLPKVKKINFGPSIAIISIILIAVGLIEQLTGSGLPGSWQFYGLVRPASLTGSMQHYAITISLLAFINLELYTSRQNIIYLLIAIISAT